MNNRIKSAFDTVQAGEELKDRTRDFLAQKTHSYRSRGNFAYRRLVPVIACCLLFLAGLGGYGVYFTPTSVISIDINPSIELGINRFDRVISVEGYNDDGDRLAESLDVRYMDYTQALEEILAQESVAGYLAQDGLLSIVVVDSDEEQSRRMLSNIESCVSGHGNAHCHSAETSAVTAAHAEGLSYGKYWAFLKLRELVPEITTEDIQDMTMREILELIDLLSGEESIGESDDGDVGSGSREDEQEFPDVESSPQSGGSGHHVEEEHGHGDGHE